MVLKINKNRANILLKTALVTMPQFGWILMPIYLYFGRILGAKFEPKSDQNALQDVFKFDVHFLFDFVGLPGFILGPSWPDKLIPGPNLDFSRPPLRPQN